MFTPFIDHGKEITRYSDLTGARVYPHTIDQLQQYVTLEDCELLRREVWRDSNNAGARARKDGPQVSYCPFWQLKAITARENYIKNTLTN